MFLLAVFLHGRGGVRRGEAGLPNYKLTSPPAHPQTPARGLCWGFSLPSRPEGGAIEPRIGPMEPL